MPDGPGNLIPRAVRVALRNAVGGSGPYTLREIEDLFDSHEFTDQDASIADAGGQRRTEVESYHARIDWTSPAQAQRYLDVVADVLDRYPEEQDLPGSPGRDLRRTLKQAGFVAPDGRLLLPTSQAGGSVEPDLEGIWTADCPRIFLSHVSSERGAVSELAKVLESLGTSCFVAHVQIEPSRDWQDVIETALRTCHALVAYVTDDFPSSNWTDQEVGWAHGRGLPVIPINAGRQPYGFFGPVQSVPSSGSAWSLGLAVFRAIAVSFFRGTPSNVAAVAPLVAHATVRAFCESRSYDSTRQRFPLLELIPRPLWNEQMLTELQEAVVNNSQISAGVLATRPPTPVPDAVRKLIARLKL